MNSIKRMFVVATIAVGLASSASANVVNQGGYTYTPDAAPNNLEVRLLGVDGAGFTFPFGPLNDLSQGSLFGGELTNGQSTAGGMISFLFRATEAVDFVSAVVSDALSQFTGLTVRWCPSGTVGGDSNTTCIGAAEPSLLTSFAANEAKWVLATWTGVTAPGATLRIEVSAPAPVPLPAAGLLLLGGLGALFGLKRRKWV